MTREEIYKTVQGDNTLKQYIKEKSGKPYSSVSTDFLAKYVSDYKDGKNKENHSVESIVNQENKPSFSIFEFLLCKSKEQ